MKKDEALMENKVLTDQDEYILKRSRETVEQLFQSVCKETETLTEEIKKNRFTDSPVIYTVFLTQISYLLSSRLLLVCENYAKVYGADMNRYSLLDCMANDMKSFFDRSTELEKNNE